MVNLLSQSQQNTGKIKSRQMGYHVLVSLRCEFLLTKNEELSYNNLTDKKQNGCFLEAVLFAFSESLSLRHSKSGIYK